MSDEYILKEMLRDQQNANMFLKKNTISSLINRINWLIEEKTKLNPKHNTHDLKQVIEILRGMND